MWKFIAARPFVARNLGQNLLSLQNSPHQVISKPLNSSSWVSNFLSRVYPAKFIHQNQKFFSQSSNGGAFDETHVNSDAQMGSIVSADEKLVGVINVKFTSETETETETKTNCSKWNDALDLLKNNVDESLESTLDSMHLCLDEEFVLGLLKNTFFPEKHLIRFFKWVSCKKEFRVTTSILEHLGYRIRNFHDIIDAYALWELVKEIGEKDNSLLNAKILNDFLVVFYCLGNVKITLEVYGKFEESGCIPDGETYYRTIKTLCEHFAYEQAISVCQKMLDTGMLPQKGVFDIISLLCEGDKAKEARTVYIAAKKTDKYSHSFVVRSLSEVVDCLTKVDETVHLTQELLLFGHHTSFRSCEYRHIGNQFLWVVRGLCRINDIEGAKKLLFEMIKKGPRPRSEVFDCLIEFLSKAGDLKDATEIFELAKRRKEMLVISSYEALICGYTKVGLMEDACKIFLAAKQKYPEFYPLGLQVLIQGYCKGGEFEKALKLFLDLKNHGVIPNVDEYNELIQSLSLCLNNLDQGIAQKFLQEMRKKGLYLPHITENLVRASTVLS